MHPEIDVEVFGLAWLVTQVLALEPVSMPMPSRSGIPQGVDWINPEGASGWLDAGE